MRSILVLGVVPSLAVAVGAASADVAIVDASLNATLFESTSVPLANGGGDWFFAGRNNQGLRRRGLLDFDLAAFAASLGGSPIQIHSVSVELMLSQGGPAPTTIAFHRVLAAWGEGTSDASGNEGQGAPATPGSATWGYSFYDSVPWSTPGGDFVAATSGTMTVGDLGSSSASSEGLRQDVLAWLADPASNHGWILIGDESINGTARRFDSRRNPDLSGRPRLRIDYSVVPAPATVSAVILAAIAETRRRRRG